MTYVITAAHPDDAASLGPLHLRLWLQTYPNADAGIDESWILEHRGSSATAEGITQWREFIKTANKQPELHFCRVVRFETEIVGYLCGRRNEVVTLGPMYVQNDAQGHGLGGRMMTEFLTWADLRASACGSLTTTSQQSVSTGATASRPRVSVNSGEENCRTCA